MECILYCVDLGLGVGHVEAISNRSREHSPWSCS